MPHYPLWNEEDIEILKENFPKLAIDGRSGPLNKEKLKSILPKRSWNSILWKARMLGLKRDFRVVYPPLDISEVDKAYIAGLIDGEGCISLNKQTRKKTGFVNYFPYISIANKNLEILKWIEEITGLGKIRRLTPPPPSKRTEKWRQRPWTWSNCYTYGVNNHASCYRFCIDIGPYMKIKKEHIDLLLEFLEIKASKDPSGCIRDEETGLFIRRLPTEITDREHEIYKNFRELNSRGWRSYE